MNTVEEKSQCTSKTIQGKRCSRSASFGDRCKTHAKCTTDVNIRVVNTCDLVYHTHVPGKYDFNCKACILKKTITLKT
jgi:hypothetical protein